MQPPEITATELAYFDPGDGRRIAYRYREPRPDAPTVLFVLEQLIDRGLPKTVLMTAFGPGFTCGGLLLEAP